MSDQTPGPQTGPEPPMVYVSDYGVLSCWNHVHPLDSPWHEPWTLAELPGRRRPLDVAIRQFRTHFGLPEPADVVRWARVALVDQNGDVLASGASAAPLTPGAAAMIPLMFLTGERVPYLIRFEETDAP